MNPIITQMSIAPGALGTQETLRIMASLARNASDWGLFQEFAKRFQSANHVDATLRPLFEYTEEPVETLFAPEYNLAHLLRFGKLIGDCDDIAMFYAAVFFTMGIQSRFVAMRTKKTDSNYFHVVIEANEGNGWKRFDPTVIGGLQQIDFGRMVVYV